MKIFAYLTLIFGFLSSIANSSFPLQIPKTFFVYWDNELEKAPMIVQLCIQKIKTVCEQEKWNLVILNQTNLQQYLPNYDEFMEVRKNTVHEWRAGVSDLVRLNVIAANGGFYMDATSILTEGLSWLDRLDQIPYLITNSEIKQGVQPDCIVPYITYFENSAESRGQWGQIINFLPGYEAWFIGCKKNASFLQKWRHNFQKHLQTQEGINRQIEVANGYYMRFYGYSDYLNVDRSAVEIIQDEQDLLDSNLTLFGERKNVNKEQKIIGLHGEYGPYVLHFRFAPRNEDFMILTVSEIQEKYYASTNFFVKFTSVERYVIDEYLNSLKIMSERFGFDEHIFEKFMATKPTNNECKNVQFIVEGSIFGILITNNSKAKSEKYFTITTEQRDAWHNYCRANHDVELTPKNFSQNLNECFDWKTFNYTEFKAAVSYLVSGTIAEMAQDEADYYKIEALFQPYVAKMRKCLLTGYEYFDYDHPAETIYWKQKFENRLEVTTVSKDIRLLWKKFSMFLFVHRVWIAAYFLVLISIIMLFVFISASTIMTLAVSWAIRTVYKINLAGIISSIQNLRECSVKRLFVQFFDILEEDLQDFCDSPTFGKFIQSLIVPLLAIFLRRILITMLGLAYIAYHILIVFLFIATFYFGKIYNQEWLMIGGILLQKLLRYSILRVGTQTAFLPNISFKYLYYVFLPFYCYLFGSFVLSLTHPLLGRNFPVSFSIAFCMSAIIKLMEHESRKIININVVKLQHLRNFPIIFIKKIVYIIINFTKWAQNFILVLLIFIMSSNLRFLRTSSGTLLAQFAEIISQPNLACLLLLIIYLFSSFLYASQTKTKAKRLFVDDQRKKQKININQIHTNISQKDQDDRNDTNEKLEIGFIKNQKQPIFSQYMKLYLHLTQYILRVCTILIFLNIKNADMRNYILKTEIPIPPETFLVIIHFLIVFITFMVEIGLEEQFLRLYQQPYRSQRGESEKVESQDEDSIQSERVQEDFNHSGMMKSFSESNNEKSKELYFYLCQIIWFDFPRLVVCLINCFYFNWWVNHNYKRYFVNHIVLILTALLGYVIIQIFIIKRIRSQIPEQKRGDQLIEIEETDRV